ncbi:hypothetical protein [Acidianus sp. HS-5]|uniref:hypothetical protein n=1 Tax=Acidianus sp. HS-5 TaxID=2886040 RepID=UPI001F3ECCFC|nr:hypothetical protein [Acidianus sp. HS-5]
MKLPLILTKRLLLNPYAIGWGIAFMYFWIAMGAFIESSSVPKSRAVYYTAGWYGVIVLLSTSTFATSIAIMIYYQSGGLSFLTRFSKLTPKYYLLSLYFVMIVTTIIVSALMAVGVISFFSYHFGETIEPKNWGLFILDMILSGIFYLPLALLLEELTVVTSRKLSSAISFIPLVFAYLFGFSYLNINLGNVVYYSPFISIQVIGMQSFFSKPIPLNYSDVHGPTLNVDYSIISVVVWSIVLSVASMLLFRRLYYKSLEEGRIL